MIVPLLFVLAALAEAAPVKTIRDLYRGYGISMEDVVRFGPRNRRMSHNPAWDPYYIFPGMSSRETRPENLGTGIDEYLDVDSDLEVPSEMDSIDGTADNGVSDAFDTTRQSGPDHVDEEIWRWTNQADAEPGFNVDSVSTSIGLEAPERIKAIQNAELALDDTASPSSVAEEELESWMSQAHVLGDEIDPEVKGWVEQDQDNIRDMIEGGRYEEIINSIHGSNQDIDMTTLHEVIDYCGNEIARSVRFTASKLSPHFKQFVIQLSDNGEIILHDARNQLENGQSPLNQVLVLVAGIGGSSRALINAVEAIAMWETGSVEEWNTVADLARQQNKVVVLDILLLSGKAEMKPEDPSVRSLQGLHMALESHLISMDEAIDMALAKNIIQHVLHELIEARHIFEPTLDNLKRTFSDARVFRVLYKAKKWTKQERAELWKSFKRGDDAKIFLFLRPFSPTAWYKYILYKLKK